MTRTKLIETALLEACLIGLETASQVSPDGIAPVTRVSVVFPFGPTALLIHPAKAATGNGKEIALGFAEVGAKGVLFADINKDSVLVIDKKSKEFTIDAVYSVDAVKVNITNEDSVEKMI